MSSRSVLKSAVALLVFFTGGCASTERPRVVSDVAIVISADATELEQLAAKETRRYLYLRTGRLLDITDRPADCDAIVIRTACGDLRPQEYCIQTIAQAGRKKVLITGGDILGTLYAAYRFIEHFGVRFYMHGDTIPDGVVELEWPEINEVGKPLFELRGIHPFHDFPEGPDWWNRDDYKAIISQLPKMRMNFFGMHCYPEGGVGPEPGVWIGTTDEVNPDGTVRTAYPARHFMCSNPQRSWGYVPVKTSQYSFGAAELFGRDEYGADYTEHLPPMPRTPEEQVELFNRYGDLLSDVFRYARTLGVKTCIGTETPLTIPKVVRERLVAAGRDPDDAAVVREVYEGMFERIRRMHPLDYYWLWTDEGWTWADVSDEKVAATERDMLLAVEAAANVDAPFALATCGWVLGPPKDRTQFDRVLPKEMPFSCINRDVGFAPVEESFVEVTGRDKWAIPWLEDDPALVSPQLWVGRMRRDAVDALRYGCTGLIGIHWRTRILGPNVSALAKAGWEHGTWSKAAYDEPATEVRDLAAEDFYLDWARTQFGSEAAEQIAEIFIRLDGGPAHKEIRSGTTDRKANLPRTSTWLSGPGGIKTGTASWERTGDEFAFVEEMEELEAKIQGLGNRKRFLYWLNTFRYAREMGEVNRKLAELDSVMERIRDQQYAKDKKALAREALQLREKLVKKWGQMVTYLLETVTNSSELGTICNIEQHSMRELGLLQRHDKALEKILGSELPTERRPWADYRGRPRIIVPTVRGNLNAGESLKLKVIILAKRQPVEMVLRWRVLGTPEYKRVHPEHLARGVYEVTIPAEQIMDDLEYYIEADLGWFKRLYFPGTAPQRNQTVVVN